jgi:competence protein ComEA
MIRLSFPIVALLVCLAAHPLAQQSQTPPKDAASARPAAMVNLNTATATELQQLPGIGAKVAARIVEYRTKKGPFKKIEELMNVQGIGEKSFLKLRSQLTVGTVSPQ